MQHHQPSMGLPSAWDDRHWTAEEDRVLLLHARDHGTKRWGDLDASGLLPKRDNKACCNRFLFLRKRFVEERALIKVSPTRRDVPVVASSRYGRITFGNLTLEACDQLFLDTSPAPVASAPAPRPPGPKHPPLIPANASSPGSGSPASRDPQGLLHTQGSTASKEMQGLWTTQRSTASKGGGAKSSSQQARASVPSATSAGGGRNVAPMTATKALPASSPAGLLRGGGVPAEMQEDKALAQLMLRDIFHGRGESFLSPASHRLAALPKRARSVKEEAAREDLASVAPEMSWGGDTGARWQGQQAQQGLQSLPTSLRERAPASATTAQGGEDLGAGKQEGAEGGYPQWGSSPLDPQGAHEPPTGFARTASGAPTASLPSTPRHPTLPQLVLRHRTAPCPEPYPALPANNNNALWTQHSLPYATSQAPVPGLMWPGRESPRLPSTSQSFPRVPRPAQNPEPGVPRGLPAGVRPVFLGVGGGAGALPHSSAAKSVLWEPQGRGGEGACSGGFEGTTSRAHSLPGSINGTARGAMPVANPVGHHGLQSTGTFPLGPRSPGSARLRPGQAGLPATLSASALYGLASGASGMGATAVRPGAHYSASGTPSQNTEHSGALLLRAQNSQVQKTHTGSTGSSWSRGGNSWAQNRSWGSASALRGTEDACPQVQVVPALGSPPKAVPGAPGAPDLASFLGLPGQRASLGPHSNAPLAHQHQHQHQHQARAHQGEEPPRGAVASSQRQLPRVQPVHPGAASHTGLTPWHPATAAGAPMAHPGAAASGRALAGMPAKRQVHSAGHAMLAVFPEAAGGQAHAHAQAPKRCKSLPADPEPSGGAPGQEAQWGASTALQAACHGAPTGSPGAPAGPGSSSRSALLSPHQWAPTQKASPFPPVSSSNGAGVDGTCTFRTLESGQQNIRAGSALSEPPTGQLQHLQCTPALEGPIQCTPALEGPIQPSTGSPGSGWQQEPPTADGACNWPSGHSSHGPQALHGQTPTGHEGLLENPTGRAAHEGTDFQRPNGVPGTGEFEDIEKFMGAHNMCFDDVLQQAISLADDLETQLNEGP